MAPPVWLLRNRLRGRQASRQASKQSEGESGVEREQAGDSKRIATQQRGTTSTDALTGVCVSYPPNRMANMKTMTVMRLAWPMLAEEAERNRQRAALVQESSTVASR